jgi:peptidoglycan hydrolase-like protein with peptidoglycan-binding domain
MEKTMSGMPTLRATVIIGVAVAAIILSGCAGENDPVARAEAQVTLKEQAVADAQADLSDASDVFCESSETYIVALDRYGDVLNETATTVGDVRVAGKDLAEPRDDALDGAQAASDAQDALVNAEQELAEAKAALDAATAGTSAAPVETPTPESTSAPLAPSASIERVEQAEDEYASALGAVTDQTPLADASEQFNSAAVALEFAWLNLFADAGCIPDEQQQQAAAAVSAYTVAVQQDLADAGYYPGAIDGVYGPETVGAVEALQQANALPVTGTIDKATADALQSELEALAGASAQDSVATTAAVQQTLKLVGFWDGPVDGVWTPELTEAVIAFQTELGVEPTGTVDAATVAAFKGAIADLQQPEPAATPTPTPTEEP